MKRTALGLLAAMILSLGVCAGANAEDLDGYRLGNSSQNLLNGGVLSETDVDAEEGWSGLNVFEDHIYYVLRGKEIRQTVRATGECKTLYTSKNTIDELCVVNDRDIYFLEDGNVYYIGQAGNSVTAISESGDVKGIIPTPYGILKARGDVFEWKLFAGDKQVLDNIYQYYTEEGYLVYTQNHEQYQVRLSRLFADDFAPEDVEKYSLGGELESVLRTYNHTEDGVCEECERNAKNFSEELYEESLKAAPGIAKRGEISAYSSTQLSVKQYEMVQRAEEQAMVAWTPVADVMSWNNAFTFKKGTTYNGIPYGQPVYTGYVPYDISFSGFIRAVNDPKSKFYTERSTYNKSAPYYSSDCSSFVSWAWGLARNTTRTLAKAGYIQQGGVYSLQVGDILLYEGSHVKMVEDVTYKDGKVSTITVIEQTPPIILRTVYGGSSRKTLGDLDKEIKQEVTVEVEGPNGKEETKVTQGNYIICRKKGVLGGTNIEIGDSQLDKFIDVSEDAWFYPYVKTVVEKEIMTGVSPIVFAPEQNLARAQLATIIYRLNGNPKTEFEQKFDDVPSGQFYSEAVTWASEFGVVTGYSDGNFGPADEINREQLATMLFRYAKKMGYQTDIFKSMSSYPDADAVSEFAQEGMSWCLWNGIITGDGGKLNPQGTVNRAVAATMVSRFLEYEEQQVKKNEGK